MQKISVQFLSELRGLFNFKNKIQGCYFVKVMLHYRANYSTVGHLWACDIYSEVK